MKKIMPDVSHQEPPDIKGSLQRVGMEHLDLQISMVVDEKIIVIPALANAYVNIHKPDVKGIHMSRIYLDMRDHWSQSPLNSENLESLLQRFVHGQGGISTESSLSLSFGLPLKRPALLSKEWGWRSYPVTVTGDYSTSKATFEVAFEVEYSSTCPCSAALSRQLVQEKFQKDFAETEISLAKVSQWLGKASSIVGVPHSQRSMASISLCVESFNSENLVEWINLVENSLKTPVQTVVKREDEQEFARLNAANLMFCEDAARKLKHALDEQSFILDFSVKVEHYESLHAHNAVSIVTKF